MKFNKFKRAVCACMAILMCFTTTACGKTEEKIPDLNPEGTLTPEFIDSIPTEISTELTVALPVEATTEGTTETEVLISKDENFELTTTTQETTTEVTTTEDPFKGLFELEEAEKTATETTAETSVVTVTETETTVTEVVTSATETTTVTEAPATNVVSVQDMNTILDTSVGGKAIFYNQLSDLEKKVYNEILTAAVKFKGEIVFDEPVDTSTYKRMFCLVNYQNPEVFWLSNKIMYDKDSNRATLMYLYDKEQAKSCQAYLTKRTKSLFSKITTDMTDLQKVIICHNWMCVNNVFSKDSEDSKNVYGALVKGVAQCEGYSKGMLYLMNKLGIPCVLITGNNEKDTSHAWVKVQIDGEWTNVDVTFDDTVMDNPIDYQNVSYKYLCVPDSVIYGVTHKEVNCYPGHPEVNMFKEPEATTYSLNADMNYGNYAETYEEAFEVLKADCFKTVEQGRRCAHVKVATDEVYEESLDRLLNGKEVLTIKKALNAHFGEGTIKNVAINPSNKLNYLEITIYYGDVAP